ncbi:TetR/AcrR family transcriptional regulator [Nocardia panacis]|uniref:TetR/AcrR family transcriptional regulator n=1 Tax=Nocardia panacis TaxID=2340916 RepID=A0A3A4JUQ2_9NOCA|nr:TetR/AcrR family transcriptional regulator [Nocardia panacis]RJO69945.1 TetR/AcrR family transcriptional regulator [Nocardia panacis]
MPRVSQEHLDRRRQQILDAAQLCFTRKGFHETSMQDVFAESGLSAGAVYRYFKSKDDLIAAIAAETIGTLGTTIATLIDRHPLPTPDELVATMAEVVVANSEPTGRIRLAPQAWALAMVRPEVADFVGEGIRKLRASWRTYAERMRAEGWLAPDADLDAVAAAILGVLPGFLLQHLILRDVDPQTMARGIRALLPYGPR